LKADKEIRANQSNTSTILANNWDRFGGRALDIFNGFILSKKLSCDFAFFWPHDHRFPEMDEQLAFFDDSFIEKYRIIQCPEKSEVKEIDFNKLTLYEATNLVSLNGARGYFKNPDFFSLPKFLDEMEESSRDLYSNYAHLVLSPQTKELWAKLREQYSGYLAVHGRYGDLVEGNFNQFVDTGKYVETLSLYKLIERLKEAQSEIVLLSDSPIIVRGIENILKMDLQPLETRSKNSDSNNDFQSQTMELLTMASSRCIYASSSSAFSILASRLGNVPMKLIRNESEIFHMDDLLSENFHDHFNHFDPSLRGKIVSRDFASILQNSWKKLKFRQVSDVIEVSYNADPEYVFSLCTSAIIARLRNDDSLASALILEAESQARAKKRIHDDPLMLVLMVKFLITESHNVETKMAIKLEMDTLNPFQFSKDRALSLVNEAKQTKAFSIQPSKIVIGLLAKFRYFDWIRWKIVVMSEETEFIYGILHFLKSQTRS
jgi:hypothetical protein